MDARIMEPLEQACYDRILLCLDSKRMFSIHDMPLHSTEKDYQVAVGIAVRRGLCECVGKRVHVLSNRGAAVDFYKAVAGE